jgi:hypothetical protein
MSSSSGDVSASQAYHETYYFIEVVQAQDVGGR